MNAPPDTGEAAVDEARPWRHYTLRRERTPTTADDSSNDIVCISMNYVPEEIGIGPVIAPVIEHLRELGGTAHVITTRPHYPQMEVWDRYSRGERDRETINGVKVFRAMTIPPKRGGVVGRMLNEGTFSLGILWHWASRRSRRAKVVVAVCPSVLGVLLAPLFRAPDGRVIAIVHDIQSGLGQTLGLSDQSVVLRALRRIERWAFNRTDHLVTLSNVMRDRLRAAGVVRPIDVVPPQVNTDLIRPMPESPTKVPVLLYSGNLGHKQGLGQLIALSECLRRRGREFQLIIRGEGSQRPMLEDEVRARGLDNVIIEPLLPKDRLSEGLAHGWIHLVPQLAEGADAALPSKVFAIMAAGRPFVATALAQSPLGQLARESGAFVCVQPNDSDALADAVEKLMDNAEMRRTMAAHGRAFVERYASHEAILGPMRDILLNESTKAGEFEDSVELQRKVSRIA